MVSGVGGMAPPTFVTEGPAPHATYWIHGMFFSLNHLLQPNHLICATLHVGMLKSKHARMASKKRQSSITCFMWSPCLGSNRGFYDLVLKHAMPPPPPNIFLIPTPLMVIRVWGRNLMFSCMRGLRGNTFPPPTPRWNPRHYKYMHSVGFDSVGFNSVGFRVFWFCI
jgi:hypothetical protein